MVFFFTFNFLWSSWLFCIKLIEVMEEDLWMVSRENRRSMTFFGYFSHLLWTAQLTNQGMCLGVSHLWSHLPAQYALRLTFGGFLALWILCFMLLALFVLFLEISAFLLALFVILFALFAVFEALLLALFTFFISTFLTSLLISIPAKCQSHAHDSLLISEPKC